MQAFTSRPVCRTVTSHSANGIPYQPTEVDSDTTLSAQAKQHVSMYVSVRKLLGKPIIQATSSNPGLRPVPGQAAN